MDGLNTYELATNTGPRHFYYRPESNSDKGVIQQIFINQEYDCGYFKPAINLMNYQAAQLKNNKQPLILDLGANIGATALYFSVEYPDSKIVAVEPEKHNVELLKLNCKNLNAVVLEGAIASRPGKLFLQDPGMGDWGFRVGASGEYQVDLFTVDAILELVGRDNMAPLICKIDIEGAEKDLFSGNFGWMDLFPMIVIELHDWMLPGQGNSRNFLKALAAYDFDFMFRGENVFCFNNRLLKDFG
jgi:FkbM family methyltransferase